MGDFWGFLGILRGFLGDSLGKRSVCTAVRDGAEGETVKTVHQSITAPTPSTSIFKSSGRRRSSSKREKGGGRGAARGVGGILGP